MLCYQKQLPKTYFVAPFYGAGFPTGVENMGGLCLPFGGDSSKFGRWVDGGLFKSINEESMGA